MTAKLPKDKHHATLSPDFTFGDFQKFTREVYGVPDDRLYSRWDLMTHQQRFLMRSLKGIRKDDMEKMTLNLLISMSFLMNIANRLHIDIDRELQTRFPEVCSYCGKTPCECKEKKTTKRTRIAVQDSFEQKPVAQFQVMFESVYPKERRTLADAGVHLAEESGEVAEAMQVYYGEHKEEQFNEIAVEIADLVSCMFGVANSAGVDLSKEIRTLFSNGCHVCYKTPCACGYVTASTYES